MRSIDDSAHPPTFVLVFPTTPGLALPLLAVAAGTLPHAGPDAVGTRRGVAEELPVVVVVSSDVQLFFCRTGVFVHNNHSCRDNARTAYHRMGWVAAQGADLVCGALIGRFID